MRLKIIVKIPLLKIHWPILAILELRRDLGEQEVEGTDWLPRKWGHPLRELLTDQENRGILPEDKGAGADHLRHLREQHHLKESVGLRLDHRLSLPPIEPIGGDRVLNLTRHYLDSKKKKRST